MRKAENKNNYESEDSEMLKLALNILQAYNWVFDKYRISLSKFKLNFEQYLILKYLKKSYPNLAHMKKFKNMILNKNINLSRLVDNLFKQGLILRNQTVQDRRMVEIVLTKKGLDITNSIETSLKKVESLKKDKDIIEMAYLNSMLYKFKEANY